VAATRPLLAALALVGVGIAGSWGLGSLPGTLALSAAGLLAAAARWWSAARRRARGADGTACSLAFALAWAVAGALPARASAAVQVFAPTLADGVWIARPVEPGRAVGNLRQPNHLSSLLLWAAIAVVALLELARRAGCAGARRRGFALLVVAVVLTASRTGR
jgi:hypothetical protein